jgi:predicted Co/Zn/Cd cation transporter (cation efflux family)
MSSVVLQIASAAAGFALITAGYLLFPGGRSLAKSLAVTVSLAIFAAFLIAAIRSIAS